MSIIVSTLKLDVCCQLFLSMWSVNPHSLTPVMSSTSSVLRVLATWAAMVVPNAMGPEGMRLGGPSLAPVGVNKHKLYWGGEKQMEKEKVKYILTSATVHKMLSANALCSYIVAFSQEVKCKSIGFCCCRSKRQVTCVRYSQTQGRQRASETGRQESGRNLITIC